VPAAREILAEYGMHCTGCSIGGVETIGEAGALHGFDDDMLAALVTDLAEAAEAMTAASETLEITEAAATGLVEIVKSEGKEGQMLQVIVDEHGGFCLEFSEETDAAVLVASEEGASEERYRIVATLPLSDTAVVADALTLKRVGGSTIDLVDGRFKLNLPGEQSTAQCCREEGAGNSSDAASACGCSIGEHASGEHSSEEHASA